MKFSRFAKRFSEHAGIVQLMDDLGNAMTSENDMIMLGGGNPAHISGMQQYFRDSLYRLINNPSHFSHVVGDYESPQGNQEFIRAVAKQLNQLYGWNLTEKNIALTIGSQSAFFYLFNMFAGEDEQGKHRQIFLPITPEYIGYGDVGLSDNLFYATRPIIEEAGCVLFQISGRF